MKKILLLVVVLLLGTTVLAADGPLDKGSVLIGGGFSFASTGGDAYASNTAVQFSPVLSFFIAPSIAIGPEISVVHASYEYGNDETNFGLGAHVGYFAQTNSGSMEVKGSFYPYLKGFLLYKSLDDDFTSLSFGGQGGFLYMISGSLGFDVNVRFTLDNVKPEGGSETRSGSIIQAGFGITGFIW